MKKNMMPGPADGTGSGKRLPVVRKTDLDGHRAGNRKKDQPAGTGSMGDLRHTAEMRLAGRPEIPADFAGRTPEEIIHELQVHQIELEMQNEALREVQNTLEESRDRYADLYEFAPAGYLTLTKNGEITEANLTGATLLGVDRQSLIRKRFTRFVGKNGLGAWREYFTRVLRTADRQVCELQLRQGDHGSIWARIESIRIDRPGGGPCIRMAISDITGRVQAEQGLAAKSHDFEELSAAYATIARGQEKLRRNEARLTDALQEKEILLAEIHHRVKNNLTAFISLLDLEGSRDSSTAAAAVRRDLKNRARSMALVHEILYRTGKFSSVEMESYLTTLATQIAETYKGGVAVRILVDARGIVLDLGRATTTGLIVTELVTNSFKYAFPTAFDCMAVRGEPCTIRITFSQEDGTYLLTVTDNGKGLLPEFDPLAARSLGLKLVNFLARHQLRAEIAIRKSKGTEFIFRFSKPEEHS